MASTFEVQDPHTQAFPGQQRPSTSSIDSNQLPPTLSRIDSESLSPINYLETPGSNSSLDQYQPSDYSDFEEDPFLRRRLQQHRESRSYLPWRPGCAWPVYFSRSCVGPGCGHQHLQSIDSRTNGVGAHKNPPE
ncbi:hypothetical protein NW754_012874 [Fusarium falciforme]|nr:hypothetical protein NW754_012874 [Fusarium falciforme]